MQTKCDMVAGKNMVIKSYSLLLKTQHKLIKSIMQLLKCVYYLQQNHYSYSSWQLKLGEAFCQTN